MALSKPVGEDRTEQVTLVALALLAAFALLWLLLPRRETRSHH
jgi:hypothetical protein